MVTTRSANIADMVGSEEAIHLSGLDEDSYWEFSNKCAFGSQNPGDHPQLEATARKIVRRLDGFPVAAKTLGGLSNVKLDEKHWKSNHHEE